MLSDIGFSYFYINSKMKMTLSLPVMYICCTYINTCQTKPNDAGHFD